VLAKIFLNFLVHVMEPGHPTATPDQCARCAKEIVPGRDVFFRVVAEVTADVTPVIDPSLTPEEVSRELDLAFAAVQSLPVVEAMDGVFRRLSFCLCASCQADWVSNPAG
jgi:hypothetical protein